MAKPEFIDSVEGNNALDTASSNDAQIYEALKKISANIEKIAKNSGSQNMGSAKSKMKDQQAAGRRMSEATVGKREQKQVRGGIDGFLDGIEDAVFGDFKKQMKDKLDVFADGLAEQLGGVSREAIPNELGSRLAKSAMSSIKGNKFGKMFSDFSGKFSSNLSGLADDGLGKVSGIISKLTGTGGQLGQVASTMSQAASATSAMATSASTAGTTMAASSGAIASGASSAVGSLAALGPAAGAAIAGLAAVAVIDAVIGKFTEGIGSVVEGFSALKEGLDGAANRSVESQRAATEAAKKRLEANVNTLIQAPFDNLAKAADDLCSAWESSISTITSAQGYSKEGLQDLISNFAERLRNEGLSSVVSSADITTNLQKVIEGGLSGAAAEEFAYIATVLEDAVPNQDFFSYASTYAAIAANATKEGLSQQQALQKANQEMEQFASNVLYASRQLAGGFSTGLTNTSELFDDAFKIVQSAKAGDTSNVSGVLTSVAGVIGAIAPDLSSSIVQAVVDSAIGGNSDTNVALRSLAGVNASNSQFLKALATDPKQIFSDLFKNLAQMQNMSQDNFMEVAEGLSEVFGISMDSLARVDFNYLASAISQMNLNNNSLEENVSLLASGQTKTTTEQLKIAEINKLMIDEGLSYVLDNEAARAIQEHMWDEQLALEMQEATYAVDLQGSALTFFEKISEGIKTITSILNPFAWMHKISNVSLTALEGKAQQDDIKQLLELGKVGRSNPILLQQLTSRNGQDLNLTQSLVEQLGGRSAYEYVNGKIQEQNRMYSSSYSPVSVLVSDELETIRNLKQTMLNIEAQAAISSKNIASSYSWGTVSKSVASVLAGRGTSKQYYTDIVPEQSLTSQVNERTKANFTNFLDTMETFVKEGKSYDDWTATASRYGIKDVATAIEDFGLTEAKVAGKFQEMEAGKVSERTYNREQTEDSFWSTSIEYFKTTAPTFHENLLAAISKFYKRYEDFYGDWVEYYVKHTAYTSATLDAYKVEQILNSDKSATGDAVNALADALLSNAVDLKDPAVQTNVLLSQVLVTLNAILQQNTKTNNSVLPTSLSALGLGLVSTT